VLTDPAVLDQVADAVVEQGLLLAPRRVPAAAPGDVALEGQLVIEGHPVTVKLVLPAEFPLSFPLLYLLPWDALGFIPHVMETSGYICYVAMEGLLLDRRDPVAIVAEAIRRASSLLRDGVTGANRADFVDEFESYWSRLPGTISVFSLLEPGGEVRQVIRAVAKEGHSYLAASEAAISSFRHGLSVAGRYTIQNALFLALDEASVLVPPRPDRPMWTAEEARIALLPGFSVENMARLRKLTKGRCKGQEYVAVGIPRPSGGTTIFGIRFDGVGNVHPLLENGTAERLVPIRLDRLERSYLVPRGGGEAELGSKRVLLAGCGSVGGYLALELARAGVLELTLVDPDVLNIENTFRHVLGWKYWGQNKVEGLKTEIEAKLPYARVNAVRNTLQGALAEGSVDPAAFDLVVCALGNPTVELAFDEYLRRLPAHPPAMYTWLEPFGIGGHAMVSGNVPGGCFACLYTSPVEGEDGLFNRAAFSVPDPARPFSRAISGCGSLHTPYGSMDASRTAVLAAGLAVDVLACREQGNPLLSWKGDATHYLLAGYEPSNRFGMSEEQLFATRYAHVSPRCPVCGGRSGADGERGQ
jgi:molybdopterin/thiamine biosynthesis adenylyltransferase